MIRNPKYPFAHANIDPWVLGKNTGLECKRTRILNLKTFEDEEYSETHYCQCVHYMAVTGADRWYLKVLVRNKGFYDFVIERSESEIDALMKAESEFWEYVKSKSPPLSDGFEEITNALDTIYVDSHQYDTQIKLFGQDFTIQQYFNITAEINEFEKDKELMKQILESELQVSESGSMW